MIRKAHLSEGTSKFTVVAIVIVLAAIFAVAGYLLTIKEAVQQTPTTVSARSVLKPVKPFRDSEAVPIEYFPELFPWPLWRGESIGVRMYPGPLPRSL